MAARSRYWPARGPAPQLSQSLTKAGAAGSVIALFAQRQLNHHTAVSGGVLADAAGALLRDFFAERRAQHKAMRDGERGSGREPADLAAVDQGVDEGTDEPIPLPTVIDLDRPPE